MLTVTLDTQHRGWLRLDFDYSPTIVAAVKTLHNREFVPKQRGGPFWRAPCLPVVMDALVAQCGPYMAPVDYDVFVACYPGTLPPPPARKGKGKRKGARA